MRKIVKENKVNSVMETAMKGLNSLIDVDAVIGKPIIIDGTTFIPVSKVTFGMLNGGGDYGEIKLLKEDNTYAGGNGAIVSIKPMCFLMSENDNYKIIPIGDSAYEKIFDKVTNFLSEMMEKN